jgi:hypothetical protein
MKTNPNDPAQPNEQGIVYDLEGNISNQSYVGLTKREHFAAMAMQGFLSGSIGTITPGNKTVTDISIYSVRIADALIEALNKQGE